MSIKKIYHCLLCNEPMLSYDPGQNGILEVGLESGAYPPLVCMKEGCMRYGLLTVTAKIEEVTEA